MPPSAATGNTRPTEGKRLNEMDRLGDLGRFPAPVLAGAIFNVLLTMAVVWHFEPRQENDFLALPAWIAAVLLLNLLPVMLLRLFALRPDTEYAVIEKMDFFRDQHKFSNWVYLAASANMALWISATWTASFAEHHHVEIVTLMLAAIVVSLAPAWLRIFQR